MIGVEQSGYVSTEFFLAIFPGIPLPWSRHHSLGRSRTSLVYDRATARESFAKRDLPMTAVEIESLASATVLSEVEDRVVDRADGNAVRPDTHHLQQLRLGAANAEALRAPSEIQLGRLNSAWQAVASP